MATDFSGETWIQAFNRGNPFRLHGQLKSRRILCVRHEMTFYYGQDPNPELRVPERGGGKKKEGGTEDVGQNNATIPILLFLLLYTVCTLS